MKYCPCDFDCLLGRKRCQWLAQTLAEAGWDCWKDVTVWLFSLTSCLLSIPRSFYRFLSRRQCTCTSLLWRNSSQHPASRTTCLTCVTSRVSCLACYSFPPRTFKRATNWSGCGFTRCTACFMTDWLIATIEWCSLTWWKRQQNSSSKKTWIAC